MHGQVLEYMSSNMSISDAALEGAFRQLYINSTFQVQIYRQVELGGKIGSLASWHLGIFASSDKCFFFVKLFKPWHLRVYRAL